MRVKMNSPEIMAAKMICKSIDNLTKEIRNMKKIMLSMCDKDTECKDDDEKSFESGDDRDK